jgi:xanthine dehydrogenase D subunit
VTAVVPGGVGDRVPRPDGPAKVTGTFEYAGDLQADGMLWGATLRSPHAHARIMKIDTAPAKAIPGVHSVLASWDVPAEITFGLAVRDEFVLAIDVVRYVGEPVAIVAADDPVTAARAAAAVEVVYEPLPPVFDPEQALTAPDLHPMGNVYRHVQFSTGDPDTRGEVVVENTYRLGMQDQAFLAPEAGLAIPTGDGGVELRVATQWMHSDRDQIAWALGLPPEKVRVVLAGVGGAFGGREDVTLQIHACMLALDSGRPVKMEYSREESFVAHRQRHGARIWLRHHADTTGRLVNVEARILVDGGAYASTSAVVLTNIATLVQGPYVVPNARVDAWAVRTNNPSCGAMRGFGVPQAAFAHEAQVDALAAELRLDPLEIRRRNALARGNRLAFGQVLDGATPVRELIDRLERIPLPPELPAEPAELELPGGVGRASSRGSVRRGVGYGVSVKNLAFAEGHPDESTASCLLRDGVVHVHCAAAEVGQGFVTVAQQIARTVLGAARVEVTRPDTLIASAGSTSASRQTMASGGAVHAACVAVRERLLQHVARKRGLDVARLAIAAGNVTLDGVPLVPVATAAPGLSFRATERFAHRATGTFGDAAPMYVAFGYAAQRAVVDVDVELGLVRVVQVASVQDVGVVVNPTQLVGQVEGGIVQGMGMVMMEEVVVSDGVILNPDLQGYVLPTIADAPEIVSEFVTEPEPGMPFGWKGVGEPPVCSAVPAVAGAIRNATGLPLPSSPIRPEHIALGLGERPRVDRRIEAAAPGPWHAGSRGDRKTPPWSPWGREAPR